MTRLTPAARAPGAPAFRTPRQDRFRLHTQLRNTASGARQKAIAGASEWLYAGDFSSDGARAAAGAWDGTLRIWDIASGRVLATLIQPPVLAGAPPEWAIALPEGHFRASPELEEAARFAAPGGAELPAAALRAIIGRRDRIAAALRAEPVPPPFFPRRRAF